MTKTLLTRRQLLGAGAVGASSLVLGGCDAFDFLGDRGGSVRDVLLKANDLTYHVQRFLIGEALAREYSESEIRQGQKPNGSVDPQSAEYLTLKANNFADYRLSVIGLVETPKTYSLAELRNMPSRTQITRHDCVEGWSCIAKWTGTPLSVVLDEVKLKPAARYIVFHCYDNMGTGRSAELLLRKLRSRRRAPPPDDPGLWPERPSPSRAQRRAHPREGRAATRLQAAQICPTIEAVSSFATIRGGNGGYWEDRGYEWYAGI